MLINKRPLAFQRLVSEPDESDLFPISPEMLVKGYDVPSIAIVPPLFNEEIDSNDTPYEGSYRNMFEHNLYDSFNELRKVKSRLADYYYDEFLQNLRYDSVNRGGAYKKHHHEMLQIGDLVAIKQKFLKPFSYPLGIVTNLEINSLNEVVAVNVRKSNGEVIRRHVGDIILLEKVKDDQLSSERDIPSGTSLRKPSSRVASKKARENIRSLALEGSC